VWLGTVASPEATVHSTGTMTSSEFMFDVDTASAVAHHGARSSLPGVGPSAGGPLDAALLDGLHRYSQRIRVRSAIGRGPNADGACGPRVGRNPDL
jgi:hypothetical protein